LGDGFLVEFLEIARRRRPHDVEALAELGGAYTRLARYAEGLAVDRELVALVPRNPTAHYNLACSLALCGAAREALDELELAVELGYTDAEHLAADDDLARLRTDARFVALLERLRRGAGGTAQG
jgi:Flp pilus assembly protein TadD